MMIAGVRTLSTVRLDEASDNFHGDTNCSSISNTNECAFLAGVYEDF